MNRKQKAVTAAHLQSGLLMAALTVTLALAAPAVRAEAPQQDAPSAQAADPHAHHRMMMKDSHSTRSTHRYVPPDLALIDMHGAATSLGSELNAGGPVMLNFIFTTCTTICPILSATFKQVQSKLGPEVERVRMISITIDPEHDTPQRLKEYAELFKAGEQWHFLTGKRNDVVAIQKAFNAYHGGKMSHRPITFLRNADDQPWTRLDGITSAADIVSEYRRLASL